jgi:hypothetical protein
MHPSVIEPSRARDRSHLLNWRRHGPPRKLRQHSGQPRGKRRDFCRSARVLGEASTSPKTCQRRPVPRTKPMTRMPARNPTPSAIALALYG